MYDMKYIENHRFNEVLEFLKTKRIILSQAEFAQKIGIQASQISEMINEKRKISERTVRRIVDAFPQININWFLTGEGEMLNDIQQNEVVYDGSNNPAFLKANDCRSNDQYQAYDEIPNLMYVPKEMMEQLSCLSKTVFEQQKTISELLDRLKILEAKKDARGVAVVASKEEETKVG